MVAVILAGGTSSRMRQNKALIEWHGLPLITHVSLALRFVFDRIIISTNEPHLFPFLQLPKVSDVFQNAGPMAGIHAALAYAGSESVFVVGCDMPYLSPDVIQYLVAHPSKAHVRVAIHEGWVHPLCGVYEQTVREGMEIQLRQEKRKLLRFLDDVAAERIPITPNLPCYSHRAFRNINTPRDRFLLRLSRA